MKHVDAINRALSEYLTIPCEGQDIVPDAMRYSVENGGKRVRPVLTLEFCQACGGEAQAALPFACAIEMVHTYSLIHDDLPCMDDDDFRRGKPSCHKQFGESYALLAGDGLLTLAFETLASAQLPSVDICRAVQTLASCAGVRGMIGGQVLDLLSEEGTPDYALLEKIDRLKTGALMEAAVLLGCIAAGVTDETLLNSARTYAQSLGLAFQIVDDILDVTGDVSQLGKPTGSDEKNQKVTFVRLLGLEQCRMLADKLTDRAIRALDVFPCDTAFLASFARELAVRKN